MLEKTLESPLDCKEIQPVHPKGHQSWVFTGRTDAEAETPIFWPPDEKSWLIGKKKKKPWCWERLKAGEEGDDRGWDGRMVWWTWVWVNSRSWWWTGRPGVLKSMGSQRVGRDWATELKGMKPTFIKHLAALRAEDDALQHRRPFLKEFDSYNITGQWFRLKNLPCRIHGLQSRAISRRCSLQIARSGGTPAVCLVKLYLTV